MLGIVDMTALRAQSVIDTGRGTSIAVTAIFRILNFIRLQGWFDSPCPSYEHFIRIGRANKQHSPPPDLVIFTVAIRDSDVVNFKARVVAYSLDNRWLQEWTWERHSAIYLIRQAARARPLN